MPDLKISQLTNGGLLQPTDQVPVARGAANRYISGSNIAAAVLPIKFIAAPATDGQINFPLPLTTSAIFQAFINGQLAEDFAFVAPNGVFNPISAGFIMPAGAEVVFYLFN